MVEHLSTWWTNVLVNLHWLQWVLLDLNLRLAEVWTKYKSCGLGPRKQPRESLLLSDSHLTNFNWITWPLFMVSHLSCGTLIRTSQPWLKKNHMQHYLKFAQCFEDEKDHVLWLTELQHRDVVYFCSGNFCHLVLFEELIYLKKNLLYIYKKYCI